MQICRFHVPGQGPRLGAVQDGKVYDLTASGRTNVASLTAFLAATAGRSHADRNGIVAEAIGAGGLPVFDAAELNAAPSAERAHLLPPIDQQEVWASGVTYLISRDARELESNQSNIYNRVYDAPRPELFFKATPNRVVGPHDYIYVRSDSTWSVPEPELVLVVNPAMEIVGYTAGNDVSSRSIEGENPLYLPQAKVHCRCCAMGPFITLRESDDVPNARSLNIRSRIRRGGEVAFEGTISTSRIKRGFEELVQYLGRDQDFPFGVFLFTGTGIVPGEHFDLTEGDEVEIEIESIGSLVNPVKRAPGR